MNRRDFMKQMAAAGTLPLCFHSFADSAVEKLRHDILLVMPDQMRGDCLSSLGHPVVRTPCLDKLAKQGVLFRRAYTPVASCIPARFALLSGLHPQTSGVVGYKAKPFFTPTLPSLLSECGYSTVLLEGICIKSLPAEPAVTRSKSLVPLM